MGTTKKDNQHASKKSKRLEVRISGSGGQGIISTGMMLGEAIAIGDGKNVSQSQSYGPEARGGATRADIIISDGEIFFPECHHLNILLAFTAEAYEKYAPLVVQDGTIIADEGAAGVLVGDAKTIKAPFMTTATGQFKKAIVANIIALGFLSTYTEIVSQKAIKEAVEEKFAGSSSLDANLKALDVGFKMGKDSLKNRG